VIGGSIGGPRLNVMADRAKCQRSKPVAIPPRITNDAEGDADHPPHFE